jgi:hypothetical protein
MLSLISAYSSGRYAKGFLKAGHNRMNRLQKPVFFLPFGRYSADTIGRRGLLSLFFCVPYGRHKVVKNNANRAKMAVFAIIGGY